MFNRRYMVISKLGWGNFSTVWEVADIDDLEKRYALKIVKSASNYAEAAEDEIEMMKALTEKDPDHKSYCAHLVDNFKSSGPNGSRIFFLNLYCYYFVYFILYLCYLCLVYLLLVNSNISNEFLIEEFDNN